MQQLRTENNIEAAMIKEAEMIEKISWGISPSSSTKKELKAHTFFP